MAIDASIPLQAKAPVFEQPDIAGTLANVAKIKAAQLDTAAKQNDEEFKLLSAATPENYEQVKQIAVQKYGPDALKMIPPAYDKAALDNLAASRLDIKDKLTLAQQKIEMELNQNKFTEEKRHNLADEAINNKKADNPFGNSLQGHAYQTLLKGDPNSPEYALATMAATQPRFTTKTNADGTTEMVAVTPELPDVIRKPGGSPAAPNPASAPGVLTPPVVQGATDATPTTQGPLLAAPSVAPPPNANPRNYSVSTIAGTQAPAKLNDDQAKAAGFSQRMESASSDLDRVFNEGYKPTVGTNIGTALNDITGTSAFLSSQGQQVDQAKRNFINAQLRRESGAAISPSEFDNANKQYFVMPGDKPEVIAQKARNRADAIKAMKISSGMAGRAEVAGATGSSPTIPISHDAIDAELARRKAK